MKIFLSIGFISILFVLSFSSCKDENDNVIIYPETFDGYLNLLNDVNMVFPSGYVGSAPGATTYSYLSANTEKWMSLKVKLEYVEGGNPVGGYWIFHIANGSNWTASQYDLVNKSQLFSVLESGKSANLKMSFPEGNGLKIRISYFENNDLQATKTKIITVN